MKLDADVQDIAKHYGVDANLIQAVVAAEGDILKAVQCALPKTKTREEAIGITCRSAAHALSDFVKARSDAAFVAFWADRWAPRGAANDPHHLNANWPKNVLRLWRGPAESKVDVGADVPGGGAA